MKIFIDTYNVYKATKDKTSSKKTITNFINYITFLIIKFRVSPYNTYLFFETFDTILYKTMKIDNNYKHKRIGYSNYNKDIEIIYMILKNKEGYNLINAPMFESDDLISYYSLKYTTPITIISTDKDLLQLLNYSHISVYNFTLNKTYTAREIIMEFGFSVDKIIIYKALFGDKSDGIKPVLKGYSDLDKIRIVNKIDRSKSYSNLEIEFKSKKADYNRFLLNLKLIALIPPLSSKIEPHLKINVSKFNKQALFNLESYYIASKNKKGLL